MSRERTVRARVSDPDLLAEFEDAEEGRTMAAVVREALEAHLLDGDESGDVGALSGPARTGIRTLRDLVDGDGVGMVPVDAAMSRVAAATNIEKGAMRSTVFGPLRERGYIGVSSQNRESFIVVYPERRSASELAAAATDESPEGARREADAPAVRARKYVNAGLEIPDDIASEVEDDELARLNEQMEEHRDDGARVQEALDGEADGDEPEDGPEAGTGSDGWRPVGVGGGETRAD